MFAVIVALEFLALHGVLRALLFSLAKEVSHAGIGPVVEALIARLGVSVLR
jgi:hypothetical protein